MADSGGEWQEVDEQPKTAPVVEPPRGIKQAHVDRKGRLTLPVPFQEYLGSITKGDRRVFATSLDARIARIYPLSVWKENEKFFEEFRDDPEAAEDISFTAYNLGGDCELDSQGRLLLPQELRRKLALENQPVWLHCYKGRINVYNSQIFDEMETRAADRRMEKLRALEQKGLK